MIMQPEQIAELLSPFVRAPLAESQLRMFETYLELLLKWNARISLTAVRDPAQIVQRHFGESLFAAERFVADGHVPTAIDLGSGAGFPGIPIAIYSPATRVILVESRQKKATFLKEAVRTLSLANVQVFASRAETLTTRAALVTMRAVEDFTHALPIAAGLVENGGRLGLLIGAAQAPIAAGSPSFHWSDPIPVPLSERRILMLGRKHA